MYNEYKEIMSKRDNSWDFIKGIAIFLVVLGHTIQYLSPIGFYYNELACFITSFHMPLFMIVSGYFANSVLTKKTTHVVKQKIIQLIIPSISTYFIVGMIKIIYSHNLNVECVKKLFINSLNSFWYLKSLFVLYLLLISLYIIYNKRSKIYPLFFLILFLILPTDILNYCYVISMIPSFFIGFLIHKYYNQILCSNLFLIIMFLLYLILYNIYDIEWYTMYSNPFEWNLIGLYKYIVRIIIGVSGALSFIIIFLRLYKFYQYFFIPRAFSYIGKLTLGIYIYHIYLILIVRSYLNHSFILNQGRNFSPTLFYILFSLIFIMASIFMIYLFRKWKFTKLFLLGEK